MFRFFSLAVLAFSLVSARPTNSSEKCDGDAAPLLQVKAQNEKKRNPCERCRLAKMMCTVKQVCCSQAETCDSNSGRGKIGHHGKSGRSKSGRSKHGHRKSGHVKSGHRKSGHVKSGRGHSGRRGKSGRLGRSGRRGNGGGTSVTDLLNGLISSDPNGAVYKGGQGVMFRDQNDGFFGNNAFKVLPGSLISNGIIAPNPVFPADENGNIDPNVASVGVILDEWAFNTLFGTNTQDEDYYLGVFYPADSNSVDLRCRSEEDQKRYDCRLAGQGRNGRGFISQVNSAWTQSNQAVGSGGFEIGNPYFPPDQAKKGGGTGCHAITNGAVTQINQLNARGTFAGQQQNIAKNLDCECNRVFVEFATCNNYAYSGYQGAAQNCWDKWIDHWVQYGKNYNGGPFPADIKNRDVAGCWMNNIRDMINLQNWFYLKRTVYSTNAIDTHSYWGWNEIPVTKSITDDAQHHETLAIVVPEGLDSLNQLSNQYKKLVNQALNWYVNKGYLVPGADNAGKRPGSYVVVLKQYQDSSIYGSPRYQRVFFCEDVTFNKYKIVYFPPSQDPNGKGACYINWNR